VDVGSRHVAVDGRAIHVYCSEACLQGVIELDELVPIEEPRRRGRARWWIAAGVVIGGTVAVVQVVWRDDAPPSTPLALAATAPVLAPAPPAPAPPPVATVATEDPPPQDEELLHELMQDAWIHPLAGPQRRMPINHTAAFGAERQGQPPPECLSGHCGVDVGGATWGEPVHAVHDGVVAWVNRGPNEEHGGVFVKLAHRNGQLFSWYFHLAAVPRSIVPGVRITVGQVIGLLGDTGVQHSGPHLHFAMTVKPPHGARERYLDPESLIAIWPLWIVEDGKGRMSTAEPPGVPVRVPPRPKRQAPAPAETEQVQNDNQPAPPPAAKVTEPAGSAAKAAEPAAAPAPATSAN
jgi:murein DD-endopeptidase MepM/ murein hydrolase activator NlpD